MLALLSVSPTWYVVDDESGVVFFSPARSSSFDGIRSRCFALPIVVAFFCCYLSRNPQKYCVCEALLYFSFSFSTECKLDKSWINIWWGWLCWACIIFSLLFFVGSFSFSFYLIFIYSESFRYVVQRKSVVVLCVWNEFCCFCVACADAHVHAHVLAGSMMLNQVEWRWSVSVTCLCINFIISGSLGMDVMLGLGHDGVI